MKALISIDYTNDFVANDGKLTTGKAGQTIENSLLKITKAFTESDEFVVYGIDQHDPLDHFHPEHTLFPPHNLIESTGRNLYGKLAKYYEETKERRNVYWLNKRRYSAFSGTDLDLRLRERKITELHLAGVCTDICILHTAIDAYNLGYELFIHQEAVASFDPIGHKWALRHFETTLGANVV